MAGVNLCHTNSSICSHVPARPWRGHWPPASNEIKKETKHFLLRSRLNVCFDRFHVNDQSWFCFEYFEEIDDVVIYYYSWSSFSLTINSRCYVSLSFHANHKCKVKPKKNVEKEFALIFSSTFQFLCCANCGQLSVTRNCPFVMQY